MKRIVIVDKNKCRPLKCNKECIKRCPPQKTGKEVIEIIDIEDINNNINNNIAKKETNKNKIAKIVESQCIGCNQCVTACPFGALKIVNLSTENADNIIHRYNPNGFRLYGLPLMKKNCIMSFIGENGIGKSTIIDILSGKIIPNFENFNKKTTDKEIIKKFNGTQMVNYFNDLYSGKLIFSIKEQKIKYMINKFENMTVKEYLEYKNINQENNYIESFNNLKLDKVLNNKICTLSGGELQRLLCWITCNIKADVYIFDEPSNFLDIKQRIEIAKLIKNLNNPNNYIIVIDHDLSMLDYISDEVNILHGKSGAFGIISNSMTLANGLNDYMDGYISSQNIRFRDHSFNLRSNNEIMNIDTHNIKNEKNIHDLIYENKIIEFSNFKLNIVSGIIKLDGSINVILGENGVGKTTFMNYIASHKDLGISYKKQHINLEDFINNDGTYPTVKELLYNNIKNEYINPVFQTNVINVLDIKSLECKLISELSGGELQKVNICYTLGKPANIYLLDEPSSNLDIENRLKCITAIKKFSNNSNKCLFVIEHDIMIAVSLSQEINSKILLIKEINTINNIKNCEISIPLTFNEGINLFLQEIGITMRLSGHNRPRINKHNSQMDKEQKKNGVYYGNCYI
jgi:ATP-binding cassette, sub-family E, member 1